MEETDIRKNQIDEEQNRLLQKMIERQERDIVISRVTAFAECILLAALIIVFAILIPRFFKTVKTVEESMEQIQQLVEQAQSSLVEITDLARDADQVIEANETAVGEAIENFNTIDFDSLNSSIQSIKEAVEPLAKAASFLKFN